MEQRNIMRKWHSLLSLIDRQRKFDYDLFKEAYLQTFAVLQPVSMMEAVPKGYMELFGYAYEFATHEVTGISAKHDAAGELVGMMLDACCLSQSSGPVSHWENFQKQWVLPLGQVDMAIDRLATQYEADYADLTEDS